MPNSISQDDITKNMKTFMGELTNEQLPAWVAAGLCDGFAFFMFRADLIGQQDVVLQRLHRIADAPEDELRSLGRLLALYKGYFGASYDIRQENLKNKIQACHGDATLIAKVRADHAAETNALKIKYLDQAANYLAKEQLESSMPPIIAESPDEMRRIHDEEIKKRVAHLKEQFSFAEEFYTYINMLLFSQSPEKVYVTDKQEKSIHQKDYLKKMSVVMPDLLLEAAKDSKQEDYSPIREDLNFGFVLRQNELIKFLNDFVKDGDLIRLGSTDHTMYVTKKNGTLYSIYDSNNKTGVATFESVPVAALVVRNGFFTDFAVQDQYMPFTIKIYRKTQSEPVNRPAVDTFIDEILKARAVQIGTPNAKNVGIDDKTWDSYTALMLAARCDDHVSAEKLVALDADLGAANERAETALTFAASCGSRNVAKIIINKLVASGESVDQLDRTNATPFYYACTTGNAGICLDLLNAGADVNHRFFIFNADKTSSWEATPLRAAVVRENVSAAVIELLLRSGAIVTETIMKEAMQNKALLAAHPEVILHMLFILPKDQYYPLMTYNVTVHEAVIHYVMKKDIEFLTTYPDFVLRLLFSMDSAIKADSLLPYAKHVDVLFKSFQDQYNLADHDNRRDLIDMMATSFTINDSFAKIFAPRIGDVIGMIASDFPNSLTFGSLLQTAKAISTAGQFNQMINEALLIAAEKGHTAIYRTLTNFGADIQTKHANGQTAAELIQKHLPANASGRPGLFRRAPGGDQVAGAQQPSSPDNAVTPASASKQSNQPPR